MRPLEHLLDVARRLVGPASALVILTTAPVGAELNPYDNRIFQFADAEDGDRYGEALAVGDFNCDGDDDLAIGIPGADVGKIVGAGKVEVRLSVTILVAPRGAYPLFEPVVLTQPVVPGPELGDGFGTTLAAGDINGDGCDDLVVGSPLEDLGAELDGEDNGGIHILYGHSEDPFEDANFLTQNTIGLASDGADFDDQFGSALAVGDFDGDDYDDIAVGVSREDQLGASTAGAVHIIYGSDVGPNLDRDEFLTEGSNGYLGSPTSNDQYGYSLAVGDFDGDDFDDLAIGVIGQQVDGQSGAGDVHVIYGTALGLSPANEQRWSQSGAIAGTPQASDRFGSALAAADFDGDGVDDLAVGVAGESVVVNAGVTLGRINVIYGTAIIGLTTADNAAFDASTPGFADLGGDFSGGDVFYPTPLGSVLAAGDIDGDGYAELLMGLPTRDHTQTDGPNACVAGGAVTLDDVGSVLILHGSSEGVITDGNEGFVNWHDDGLSNDCMWPDERLGGALAVFDVNRDGQGDLAVGIPRSVDAVPIGPGPGVRGIEQLGEVVVITSGIFASGFEPDPVAFAVDGDDDWDLPSVP